MEQKAFFYLHVDDAIREDIRCVGDFKEIGHDLRPKKSPEDAATWLRNATNPNQKDEGIDQYELMHILRKAAENRSCAFLDYLGQELGFRVEWTDPESEAAKDRRHIRELLRTANAAFERMERNEQRANLKVAK